MSCTTSQDPVTTYRATQYKGAHGEQANIRELNLLAVKGLIAMFDSESQLFCFRMKQSKQGLAREGLSHRYTIITLLGLSQVESSRLRPLVDLKPTLENLLKNTSWLNNIGDLGLLLWLCALALPERLPETYISLDVKGALSRYRDAREKRTMELAWFLSGLAHATLARQEKLPGLMDLAVKTFHLLKSNQGSQGIFGHLPREGTFAGALRGRIGSFADQVYPIYALCKFAQAYGIEEAVKMAQACGETICRVQGPLGQWWWHYDSLTGEVVGRYPVFSVHQDGMAPMALFALGKSIGEDLSPWIYRGQQWISGKNELGRDLRETSTNIIWRSIYQAKCRTYFNEAKSLLGFGHNNDAPSGLRIRFECRPYHFGWLLYAFANEGFV